MKVQIEVKQSHIDEGLRRDCLRCPIALAINEKLYTHYYAWVGAWAVGVVMHHASQAFEYMTLPEKAQKCISDIDLGKPVSPFTFEVDTNSGVEVWRKDEQ